jgi:UTP:GlnB (protein PII) uridylyltransferase
VTGSCPRLKGTQRGEVGNGEFLPSSRISNVFLYKMKNKTQEKKTLSGSLYLLWDTFCSELQGKKTLT